MKDPTNHLTHKRSYQYFYLNPMKLILNCKCGLNFHKKNVKDIKVFDNLVHTKLIYSQSFPN